MQKFKIFQTQQTPKIFIVISAATNSKTCGHMCICCKQQWIRAVMFLKWKWKVLDSIYHKMPLLKQGFKDFQSLEPGAFTEKLYLRWFFFEDIMSCIKVHK